MNGRQVQATYRWMAPVYDVLFRRMYAGLRRRSIVGLALSAADSVVLAGIGTGQDLAYLPPALARLIGVDLSRPMLSRAVRKRMSPMRLDLMLGSGTRLPLRSSCVSVVVLHLVLSVTPEPRAMLEETARVLAPGGRVAILDHFARPGRLSPLRRLFGSVPRITGTHFDRTFEELASGLPFRVQGDAWAWQGTYRLIRLERTDSAI